MHIRTHAYGPQEGSIVALYKHDVQNGFCILNLAKLQVMCDNHSAKVISPQPSSQEHIN